MSIWVFRIAILAAGLGFTAYFGMTLIPALVENPDIFAALAAGMVNPFAATYSMDAVASWFILSSWVIYEARTLGVRNGWLCIVLGLCPGVALAFAVYLIIRAGQIEERSAALP